MIQIKMQCRDNKGNVLAYHNNVEKHLIKEFIIKWNTMYGDNAYMISVHYIYNKK